MPSILPGAALVQGEHRRQEKTPRKGGGPLSRWGTAPRRCPGKKFYPTRPDFVCADMKKITPDALERVFAGEGTPVEVAPELAQMAAHALRRMLELAQ